MLFLKCPRRGRLVVKKGQNCVHIVIECLPIVNTYVDVRICLLSNVRPISFSLYGGISGQRHGSRNIASEYMHNTYNNRAGVRGGLRGL